MSSVLKWIISKNSAPGLKLLEMPLVDNFTRRFNSNRASIAKIGRLTYIRTYPTLLVLPDGSTINIRYHEPRKIIKLPLDINALSEEERQLRLLKRQPKERTFVEEEIESKLDVKRYLRMTKSRTRKN